MAYIGQPPFQEFTSVPTKDSFTGDGSTTTFDLANDVARGAENALEVFVNNVRQEPGSGKAFTLGIDGSNNYRRITFTAAPASSAAIYVINDKTNLTSISPVNTDFNGAELVLDADGDTTLHASTDDIIDLRIAGADVLKFAQSSGDAIIKNATDAKDLIFQQADGNKLFEINDGNFVGVGGNATAPGEIRIFEDTDLGTNYSGFTVGNLTASVAYILPAADGSSGTHLTTDGSGALSWTASVSLANDTNNRIITGTGSGLNGEANLTFDGSTLAVTGAITGSSDLTLQDDLILDSDAAVLSFGADNEIALTHVADTGLLLTDSGGTPTLQFHDANESISSDGTDLILAAGADINLTATTDINIPANVGLTFGNDAEKIEGDGTDLTIAGNNINLTATADVVIPANVGITFGTGEKIEGDSTDLTITSGAKINLTATSDIVVPANVGVTFGTGEKIEGDNTDLTVTSGAKINLNATSDVHLPNNVGITFGGNSENIQGDGTDLIIAGNNIKLTAAADIILDAAGNDFQFKAGGTHVLSVVNSSSDVIIKPIVDAKDIIFQQRDGTEVARIEDNATFNVVTDKLAINGTAVTSTAAELNKLDGVGVLKQAGKETIWIPSVAMKPTASNPCADIATVETTSGRPDMNVLDFDKDADEFAQFAVAFPKSWNAGTVTFQFFWSGIAATTGVAINLQGVAFADNDSIDTAYGTAVVVQDDAQGAVEELLVSAESGAVTIAGSPGANELTYFRVGRDVSDGNDDMAGDCRLHGIKLHFTTNAANDA